MNLWHFFGNWHPKLVQFPLVLLLAGLLFDLAGLWFRSARAHWAALILTAAGTLSLLFAFICGIYAEVWAGRSGVPQDPIELHELMANIASWGFVLLFAWRILLRVPQYAAADETTAHQTPTLEKGKRATAVYVGVGLFWYLLLVLTAYLGGQLVFAYGAGVTGAGSGSVLTMEDLNTLASRQTDENLRYSEWMHHVFGCMTLGLAASLLAQAIFPKSTPRLKWIVPTFLLAGGIFLFFMADRDLYSLTDPHQWRDREVQLHKSLALIMTTIGVVGLYRIFRPAKTAHASNSPTIENQKSAGDPPKNPTPPEPSTLNSKLVAVLAVIGGALLFTHVHTVAPYANVAAGVYIAHIVLGLVALSIGATRLLQDYLPRRRRALATAFAIFMGIESILLITYNEGLPWYIGYGTYNRWGPNHQPDDEQDRDGITVAPFGDFRALMMVNQADGKIFVAFRKRFDTVEKNFGEDEVTLTLDAPPILLITRGTSELALPLIKSVAQDAPPDQRAAAESGRDLTGSNFRTDAAFVKTAPYLSARLILKINGRERIGYFDPWVTPAIKPVPANELAKFQCPMHEGVRSIQAGTCPLCGMDLVPIQPPLPLGQLHDANFGLDVTPAPADSTVAAGPLDFAAYLRPFDGNSEKTIKALMIVHEQPIHLIVVSQDLAWFDHIHPTPILADPKLDGTFLWHYHFPAPGNYLLFAQYTAAGSREQTFRYSILVDNSGTKIVSSSTAPDAALLPDAAGGKLIGSVPFPKTPQDSAALNLAAPPLPDVRAELLTQPRTLYAGLHAQLIVRLSDAQGKPISDLSPYLGAAGHCVIISQDTQTFIHCHPEQFHITQPGDTFGPEIAFHAQFPTPGIYRLLAQIRRGDRLIIAPFTVKVDAPPVPAALLRFLLNE